MPSIKTSYFIKNSFRNQFTKQYVNCIDFLMICPLGPLELKVRIMQAECRSEKRRTLPGQSCFPANGQSSPACRAKARRRRIFRSLSRLRFALFFRTSSFSLQTSAFPQRFRPFQSNSNQKEHRIQREILDDKSSIQTQRLACAFPVRLGPGGGGRPLRICDSLDSGSKNRTFSLLFAPNPTFSHHFEMVFVLPLAFKNRFAPKGKWICKF
ncbi:MAG: hypothetical protein ABSA83_01065 [Verrucomicrobiota bacterium]